MTTMPTRLRQLLPAVFVTAAVAVALGCPATAGAAWDIEEYDNCIRDLSRDGDLSRADQEGCCLSSGGNWVAGDFGYGYCVAPPAGEGGGAAPPPKAGLPTVPVQPPLVGDPTTLVIVPTVPVQSPTNGIG
jgi:hypothetical protein